MYKDIQTAVSFVNLSDLRRARLSALISGTDRAWRVYDNTQSYRSVAACHAVDTQKASARLLRLGRR